MSRGLVALGVVAVLLLPITPLATDYVMTLGIAIAVFAVLSTGLNLVYGYVGLMSFAQVAFFGIGGYTSALLVTRMGWTMWEGSLAGGALATLVGLAIGYSSLRLSRDAFAIVSLSFSLLCMLAARDWVGLTRGSMGIPGLPAPVFQLPGLDPIAIAGPRGFYCVLVPFALLALAAVHRIVRSRIGRTLLALRLNEPMAQSQGIDPLRHKLLALGVSALISGMVGGIYVFSLTIVDPSVFDFYYTETMLIMVIVGGPGSFWGVLAATAVFSIVPDLLRFSADLRMVLYGVVLVAAMLAFPDGLAGLFRRRPA